MEVSKHAYQSHVFPEQIPEPRTPPAIMSHLPGFLEGAASRQESGASLQRRPPRPGFHATYGKSVIYNGPCIITAAARP